jgi:hypothetical protein
MLELSHEFCSPKIVWRVMNEVIPSAGYWNIITTWQCSKGNVINNNLIRDERLSYEI